MLAIAFLASGAVGCQSNPSGRVGVMETTEAETESAKVLPTALMEFSDQVARQLTGDLAELPRISQSDGKATVLFGDLNNQTQVTSTNDFELMTARLRDNLINSEFARKKVRFVADRDRMRDLARQEEVGSRQGHSGPGPYDPQSTFVLTGDFYRINRGDMNQYLMRFELSHFASGETIFSNRYDIKQVKN
jgi:PBP1b-binding outer membrane lipoprotein LpoB